MTSDAALLESLALAIRAERLSRKQAPSRLPPTSPDGKMVAALDPDNWPFCHYLVYPICPKKASKIGPAKIPYTSPGRSDQGKKRRFRKGKRPNSKASRQPKESTSFPAESRRKLCDACCWHKRQ